jgi:hypothetical protein
MLQPSMPEFSPSVSPIRHPGALKPPTHNCKYQDDVAVVVMLYLLHNGNSDWLGLGEKN